MRKFLVFGIPLLLAGFASPSANAVENYVSVNGGLGLMSNSTVGVDYVSNSDTDISLDESWGTGSTVGAAYGLVIEPFRTELAVGYQNNKLDDIVGRGLSDDQHGDVSVLSMMVNGYYDFDIAAFQPYVTCGIGYARVGMDYYEQGYQAVNDIKSAFAYHFGAGVGVPITKCLTFDVGYRYFATTDVKYDSVDEHNVKLTTLKYDIATSNIIAGLRYTF